MSKENGKLEKGDMVYVYNRGQNYSATVVEGRGKLVAQCLQTDAKGQEIKDGDYEVWNIEMRSCGTDQILTRRVYFKDCWSLDDSAKSQYEQAKISKKENEEAEIRKLQRAQIIQPVAPVVEPTIPTNASSTAKVGRKPKNK